MEKAKGILRMDCSLVKLPCLYLIYNKYFVQIPVAWMPFLIVFNQGIREHTDYIPERFLIGYFLESVLADE